MPVNFKKTAQSVVGYLIGGIAATGVIGGGLYYGGFATLLGPGRAACIDCFVTQKLTITGSTDWVNGRYAAGCLPIPLSDSGVLLEVGVHMKKNPDGLSGDIYWTKDCKDNTQTGHLLIADNLPTNSGAFTRFAFTGSQVSGVDLGALSQGWDKANFLKFTFATSVVPNTSGEGYIYAKYMDNFAE